MEKLNLNYNDKQKKIELIYILCFSIAFLTRMGKSEINYFIKYIIALLWIGIAFFKLWKSDFKLVENEDNIKFYFRLFFIPYIIMCVYNVFLFATNRAEIITLGRSISYIVTMIITIASVFATTYLLKKRTLICTIYSMFLSFLIVIIFNICTDASGALKGIIDSFLSNANAVNYFEVHDLTFAFGLILLLYIFRLNKFEDKNLKIIIGSVVVILMGFKRIQIISIIIMIIYIAIIKIIKEDMAKKLVKITGISLFAACILYVWIIKVGILENIINDIGVNTMGRIYFYKWVSTYAEFKLNFLGVGLGTTSKLMDVYTKWPVATIHSDILRMFVEIGFIGFILWLWYYLIYSYDSIYKLFSTKVAITYFILTMYLYLLHFTDNTVSYFATQYVYMIIIISTSNKENNKYDISKLIL